VLNVIHHSKEFILKLIVGIFYQAIERVYDDIQANQFLMVTWMRFLSQLDDIIQISGQN
jgi:hypothetical protein